MTAQDQNEMNGYISVGGTANLFTIAEKKATTYPRVAAPRPRKGTTRLNADLKILRRTRWKRRESKQRPRQISLLSSNFLCNLGYGDESKLFPRGPRLAFNEACTLL